MHKKLVHQEQVEADIRPKSASSQYEMQLQLNQSLEALEGDLARKRVRRSHEASIQRHGGTIGRF